MRLVRGIPGHESFVWCTPISRNDVILHFHQPWWRFWGEMQVWAHQDTDTKVVAVYPVSDMDTLNRLTECETWLEVAAILRPQEVPDRQE